MSSRTGDGQSSMVVIVVPKGRLGARNPDKHSHTHTLSLSLLKLLIERELFEVLFICMVLCCIILYARVLEGEGIVEARVEYCT